MPPADHPVSGLPLSHASLSRGRDDRPGHPRARGPHAPACPLPLYCSPRVNLPPCPLAPSRPPAARVGRALRARRGVQRSGKIIPGLRSRLQVQVQVQVRVSDPGPVPEPENPNQSPDGRDPGPENAPLGLRASGQPGLSPDLSGQLANGSTDQLMSSAPPPSPRKPPILDTPYSILPNSLLHLCTGRRPICTFAPPLLPPWPTGQRIN